MAVIGHDTLKTRRTLNVNGKEFDYFSLKAAQESGLPEIERLPYSLKVLLENLLRHENGRTVTVDDIKAIGTWPKKKRSDREIAYTPARVLMQDFTGVPAVVDLAAMRDAMVAMGGDPEVINPLSPVDLVIDHSVMVDHFASSDAFQINTDLEMQRNQERYAFLRWGQNAFDNFRVVPPGTGICHQVNLEYLGQVVWQSQVDGRTIAYPDTLVGTDSHTTMINGLAVLGWGVGGIEAEAAMLGQPISMLIPEVIGFELTGSLKEGATATDLVLTVTRMLREKGVVGKFVEFYGEGLDHLPLADRATISNMAPEYGATCGIFPVDEETLRYLEFTGRDQDRIALVKAYAQAQGMWRESGTPYPVFTDTLHLDLSTVEPLMAGPKRPQDSIRLTDAAKAFNQLLANQGGEIKSAPVDYADFEMADGHVAIAAITSCTNTSNPSVMVAAGLLARNAVKAGLKTKLWVKTSLAPGSQVVTDYLNAAGLQTYLDELGFHLVGYGCTTCIGNSGPLPPPIAKAIEEKDLTVCSVLSGNRNFEGRVNPHTKANYLASPPLVVAYALAGSMRVDLLNDPLGEGSDGKPVYLKDLWPSSHDIQEAVQKALTREMFIQRYGNVFEGDEKWRGIATPEGKTYAWDTESTYVQHPPYFIDLSPEPAPASDIKDARPLAILGDSVTTDHISPAGSISAKSPAAKYLMEKGVDPNDFNSYGSRRGNHEVMMRGTFGNIRLQNEMTPNIAGGYTRIMPAGEETTIYEAAMHYAKEGTPLVVVAGKEYGTGSSRDWAAKGTLLLGVRAVIAESFERIHRSNLVGMGILPLQFAPGISRKTLNLDGSETFSIDGIACGLKPRAELTCTITHKDGGSEKILVLCRIDTVDELEYYRHGGILPYVLRKLGANGK